MLRVKWPFSSGTCQKHMVFMVLGRFETSQGLLCNLSGVPGTYEKHMVFMALGRRGLSRGVLLGRRGPSRGVLLGFLRPPARSWRDPEAFLPYLHDSGQRPSGSKPSPYGKNVSEAHSKNTRIVSTARRARVCRHVAPRAATFRV